MTSVLDLFVGAHTISDGFLLDLFETIDAEKEAKGGATSAGSKFFIQKCETYMKQKGKDAIMLGRDRRVGREGSTLLHACARAGNVELILYLIRNDANLNAVDTSLSLRTPIMIAIDSHMFDSANVLAANGADLMLQDMSGYNVLHYLAKTGSALNTKRIVMNGNLSPMEVQLLAQTACAVRKYSCTTIKAQDPAASYPVTRDGPKTRKVPLPEDQQRTLPQMEGCLPDELCEQNTVMHDVLKCYKESGMYRSAGDVKKIRAAQQASEKNKSKKRGSSSNNYNNNRVSAQASLSRNASNASVNSSLAVAREGSYPVGAEIEKDSYPDGFDS